MNETPQEYAKRREQETGRPYLVTVLGHSFIDCIENRKLSWDLVKGDGICPFCGEPVSRTGICGNCS